MKFVKKSRFLKKRKKVEVSRLFFFKIKLNDLNALTFDDVSKLEGYN